MLDAQEAASGKKRGVAQRDGDTKQGRFSARTVLVLNSDDPPCLVLLNLVHLSFALSRATAKVAVVADAVSAPALVCGGRGKTNPWRWLQRRPHPAKCEATPGSEEAGKLAP